MIPAADDDIFIFAKERHEYRIGGRLVPSVTQVLKQAGLVRFRCSHDQLKVAAKRGSNVHMAVCDLERGGPDYWTDSEIGGYVRAWVNFKAMAGYVSAQSEGRLHNKMHGYAGCFDNLGWINHATARQRNALVEIKTGVFSEFHREQTAGYAMAIVNGNNISAARLARLGVYLHSDGKFNVQHFDDPRDGVNFLAALAVARMRAERKLCNDDEVFDQIVNGLDPYDGLETMLRAWSVG